MHYMQNNMQRLKLICRILHCVYLLCMYIYIYIYIFCLLCILLIMHTYALPTLLVKVECWCCSRRLPPFHHAVSFHLCWIEELSSLLSTCICTMIGNNDNNNCFNPVDLALVKWTRSSVWTTGVRYQPILSAHIIKWTDWQATQTDHHWHVY